jgi:hypothetical protein
VDEIREAELDNSQNRKQRRAAKAEGIATLDPEAFVKMADRFIDVANRENRTTLATDVHMAFLFAAARYNAFVAKNVLDIPDHEKFVEEMAGNYMEMLRNHLADPSV